MKMKHYLRGIIALTICILFISCNSGSQSTNEENNPGWREKIPLWEAPKTIDLMKAGGYTIKDTDNSPLFAAGQTVLARLKPTEQYEAFIVPALGADYTVPILKTYDLEGKEISTTALGSALCGNGYPGLIECQDLLIYEDPKTFKNDFRKVEADTDEEGNPLPGTERILTSLTTVTLHPNGQTTTE